MIKRLLPWDGLGREIVAHGGVLYIGGVVWGHEPRHGWPSRRRVAPARQIANSGRLEHRARAAGNNLLTDLADKPDFNRVWKAHFNEVNLPARATIGVADLGTGVKLELVATPALDEERSMQRKRMLMSLTSDTAP
jgi:hypothetical protein